MNERKRERKKEVGSGGEGVERKVCVWRKGKNSTLT